MNISSEEYSNRNGWKKILPEIPVAGLPVLGGTPRRRPPDVRPRAAGVVRPVHLRRRHCRLRRRGGCGDRLALPHEGLVLLLLLLLMLVVHGGGVRERGVPRLLLRH